MPLSFLQVLAIFGFLIAFWGICLGTVITWSQTRTSIELNHPALWKELGSPGFSGFNPVARHRLGMFIISGRFRSIGDPELSKLGNRARAMVLLQMGLFSALAIGIFLLPSFIP